MAATRSTAIEAIAEIPDGATIMVGGFGLVGAPLTLIDALVEHSTATDLTIISNNTGEAGRGLGLLLRQGRIKKAIASFFTSNPEAVEAAMTGAIEYELLPQGTLAEAIRAGGAGIAGFYTPVGARTELAKGHEERVIDGVPHILQAPLRADVSLVYATWGDELGNLRYRRTAQNWAVSLFMMTHPSASFGDLKSHPIWLTTTRKLLTFKPSASKASKRPRPLLTKSAASTTTTASSSASQPPLVEKQRCEYDVRQIEPSELKEHFLKGERKGERERERERERREEGEAFACICRQSVLRDLNIAFFGLRS